MATIRNKGKKLILEVTRERFDIFQTGHVRLEIVCACCERFKLFLSTVAVYVDSLSKTGCKNETKEVIFDTRGECKKDMFDQK